uniref:Ribosomal protein S14 n=1 Tax=Mesocestoides corti TaxID=53468 RepID=A0A5K3F532_MESCO
RRNYCHYPRHLLFRETVEIYDRWKKRARQRAQPHQLPRVRLNFRVVSRALSQQQAEQRGLVEMSATVLYAAASHRDKFGFNLKAPLQEQQNCKRLASAARQTVLAWTRVTNPNPHRHRARHYPPPGVENRPSPLSPPTKPKKRVAAEPPVAAADASSTSYSPFSLSLAFV